MIFVKLAFSIKVRKWLDFAFVFRGQNEENPFKNRIQKRIVFQHRIWRGFPSMLGVFGSPKIIKKPQIFEKLMFESVLWSTIALELLFGWISSPWEFDFVCLSLQHLFFWVPHRIWRDMCEAFQVEELALMIRATRGRSRRPNHMRSHLDALKRLRMATAR